MIDDAATVLTIIAFTGRRKTQLWFLGQCVISLILVV